MEQICLRLYALISRGTDSGAKTLVKYYVKPDVLFCVALKVRAGHHLFGQLGAKVLKI